MIADDLAKLHPIGPCWTIAFSLRCSLLTEVAENNSGAGNSNALAAIAPKAVAAVENSVVKVFATVRYPDHFKPWAKHAPAEVTGSGAVIAGKRILSNAHIVLYASQVQVQVQASQAGDQNLRHGRVRRTGHRSRCAQAR